MFDIIVLLTAIFASMASAILGVFLVLRKMSMTTDAISHTVLLGIVLSFLIVKNLDSPLLIVGATVIGVVTTYLIEVLVKTRRTTEDAATGIIFPLLFAIAVIIISVSLRNVHLDIDAVLLGFLELVTKKRMFLIIGVFLLNLVFFLIFYKELKIVSFDSALASVLGISPLIIHYSLMGLVSLTAVISFDAVGSILVIALMIGPAASALLVTKKLFKAVILAMVFASFSATLGYFLGLLTDLPMSGLITIIILVLFLVILFFEPRNGVISKIFKNFEQRKEFAIMTVVSHINNHQNAHDYYEETHIDKIHNELKWNKRFYKKIIYKGMLKGYIKNDNSILKVTSDGNFYLQEKIRAYDL